MGCLLPAALGSVRRVVEGALGEQLGSTGGASSTFGYTGEWEDDAAGLL